MLTDRQFVALQLFQSVIGSWSEVLFISRTKQTETIKTLANSALAYADVFLAESGGNIDIEVIEKEFKDIGIKLEEMNQLNQQLSESNKALLDLVNNNTGGELRGEMVSVADIYYFGKEEKERDPIAWIDGEAVYAKDEEE